MVDFSIYIHTPFCTKKCGYCHFFVIKDDKAAQARFTQALLNEILLKQSQLVSGSVKSLYFGGGTPSLLALSHLAEIMHQLKKICSFAPDIEITLEANPESFEKERFKEFKALGFNRLSFGVQALSDPSLKLLTRNHTSSDACLVVESAANYFENISIDLMMDVPDQTAACFQATLDRAILLPITHLSLYNLTFEPMTPFFRKRKELIKRVPNDDESHKLLQCAKATLQRAGFERYEISAFAKPSFRSKHNVGYWTARPYLGLGPSAHSYWQTMRYATVSNFSDYCEKLLKGELPEIIPDPLCNRARKREQLIIRLRLFEPVDITEFNADSELQHLLRLFEKRGWVKQEKRGLSLTESGALFYDTIASELVEI